MDKNTFIKIKLTGQTPAFKDLMGLIPDQSTSELLDFCVYMHESNSISKHGVGNTCRVETGKSSYSYQMFKTHILRTDIYREKKVLYKR